MGALVRPDTLSEADVPFVATPYRTARHMLELADVSEDDVVYDLGSGDGRLPILAAKEHDASAVGLEIQPKLVQRARQNARLIGVADEVEFRRVDLFEADFSDATVVTIHLLPEINEELAPILLDQLAPGTRIVSRGSRIGHWAPDRTVYANDIPLHLWTAPGVGGCPSGTP